MRTEQLIREYVSLVLEKIRTYGDGRFDVREFKKLDDPSDIMAYVRESGLERLGEGSSRIAYLFSSRYVLKVAKNRFGIAQNETEVDIITDPKTDPVVANIRDFHPRYYWLISELVRPMQDEGELDRRLKIVDFYDVLSYAYDLSEGEDPNDIRMLRNATTSDTLRVREMAEALAYLMQSKGLRTGDLYGEHFGKTPDGRIVLLDYGFADISAEFVNDDVSF